MFLGFYFVIKDNHPLVVGVRSMTWLTLMTATLWENGIDIIVDWVMGVRWTSPCSYTPTSSGHSRAIQRHLMTLNLLGKCVCSQKCYAFV